MSATPEFDHAADAADSGLELVLPGRGVAAGEGIAWIGEGWKLFARSPLMWIIALVIVFIVAIVLAIIPILGQVAFQLLNPVIVGGLVVACRAIERGGEFELEHLFAGFKSHFGGLVILGAIFLAMSFAILLVFGVFFGFSILTAVLAGDPEQLAATLGASLLPFMLGMLVCTALFVPVMAAYWFAPALIMMHGMTPVAAMKASFWACLRNIIPFLIYSVVMGVLALLAVLPFGLGMLVWLPLMITSWYASYRAIFTTEAVEAPRRPVMVG